MLGYLFLIMVSLLIGFAVVLPLYAFFQGQPHPFSDITWITWSILGAVGGHTFIGLWGITAIAISKQQEKIASQPATLSRKSWHFRLNCWIISKNWEPPKSECEYWAQTATSILALTPIFGLVFLVAWIFVTLVRVLGFFVGFKPDMTNPPFSDDFGYFSEKGWHDPKHQWFGPVVTGLLLIGYAVWFATENEQLVKDVIPIALGITTGLTLFMLCVLARYRLLSVAKWIASPFLALGSALLMRMAGVCRRVTFVD